MGVEKRGNEGCYCTFSGPLRIRTPQETTLVPQPLCCPLVSFQARKPLLVLGPGGASGGFALEPGGALGTV